MTGSSGIMEEECSDKNRQGVLDFKCRKILSSSDKPFTLLSDSGKTEERKDSNNVFASSTPDKPVTHPIRSKHCHGGLQASAARKIFGFVEAPTVDAQTHREDGVPVSDVSQSISQTVGKIINDEQIELSGKYKELAELFDRIETSVRLHSLRKKLPVFHTISTQVEILTKRKLLYSHVAQIKYLYSEAILIEKILVHDEKSLCMKPDMKITISFDAAVRSFGQSASHALRQEFRARLVQFISSHSEDEDVPEDILPEPFHQRNQMRTSTKVENVDRDTQVILLEPSNQMEETITPYTLVKSIPDDISHLALLSPLPYDKKFSQKVIIPDAEKTQLLAFPSNFISVNTTKEISHAFPALHKSDHMFVNANQPAHLESTPSRHIKSESKHDESLGKTPVQKTPQRPNSSPDEKCTRDNVMSSHSSRRRALHFDRDVFAPVLAADVDDEDNSVQGGNFEEREVTLISYQSECKGEHLVVNDSGLSKRQQVISCLPELFESICSIFQAAKGYSITKQELMHKIIMSNYNIVDISEIEEQLNLLEELVPDWICGKIVPSGDHLYCIKKIYDPQWIRTRLVGAE